MNEAEIPSILKDEHANIPTPNLLNEKTVYSDNVRLDTQEIAVVSDKEIVQREGVPLKLSPEQLKIADSVAQGINLYQISTIQNIDIGINDGLSEFNSKILSQAKIADLGESGSLIADIKMKAKNCDPYKLMKPGMIAKIFGKAQVSLDKLKSRFQTVEDQFNYIANRLKSDNDKLEHDLVNMEKLYVINRSQFSKLEAHIYAAQKVLNETNQNVIPVMEKEVESGNQLKLQELTRLRDNMKLLDKKISDMIELRLDCIHTAQIIHIMIGNSRMLIETNRNAVYSAIENWKKSVAIALSLDNQKKAAQFQKEFKDFDNQQRIKNAEMLEMGSVQIAEISERGAIDYKTLEIVNDKLISTMDKIEKIHEDARIRRIEENKKIRVLELKLHERVMNKNSRINTSNQLH